MMTFSWDINTATLLAIGLQIVVLTIFLSKLNARANSAYELAEKAHRRADDAHTAVIAVSANIALLREQVARENPNHKALGDMEQRLTTEIHRITDRMDDFISSLSGFSPPKPKRPGV